MSNPVELTMGPGRLTVKTGKNLYLQCKMAKKGFVMLLPPPSATSLVPPSRRAFTLVEMLVVMGIILVLISLIGPALNSLKGGNDINRAAADITSMFQICRSYAVTNNTYVYLGIGEFDASVSESDTQKAASGNVGGRIAMVAIASRDGTRHYSPYATTSTDIANGWADIATGYANGANFKTVTKLQRYDNLHMFSYGYDAGATPPGPPIPTTGGMQRPNVVEEYFLLGDSYSDSATPITYPLGAKTAQYTFKKVIQFDSEGLARICPAAVPPGANFTAQGVPVWMEFGLIAARGNVTPNTLVLFPDAPSQNKGDHICLQIDGMKASVHLYRPGS